MNIFSNRTQYDDVPLKGVILNLGIFAWVAFAAVSISNFFSATFNFQILFRHRIEVLHETSKHTAHMYVTNSTQNPYSLTQQFVCGVSMTQ